MASSKEAIEQAFNLKIVGEQFFPWGESYWLQLDPDAKDPKRTVSVVTIHPDKEQKIHTHAGYEEIIYGLEGESIHWCNDRKFLLCKGQIGYIRSGGKHAMLNKSDRDCVFLSIVYPTIPTNLTSISRIDEVNLQEISKTVNLETIADKFADSVGLAVTLVDDKGNLLTKPKNLPQFCMLCMRKQQGDCVINPGRNGAEGKNLFESRCKFGISSVQSPIIINERLLGYLGCGYGRLFAPTKEEKSFVLNSFCEDTRTVALQAYINLDIINRNHLHSVAETLSLVSVSLVQLMVDSIMEKQIDAYKLSLSREINRKVELENSLNEVRLKFLEAQINPHFLFNTLNTIAQTSVMEGADLSASLTYALSNLLRYSLNKTGSLISVKEELNLVNDYLMIQKTRFPDRFQISIDVSEDILDVKIPFMTLIVLVENSIVHGFSNVSHQGVLEIRGYKDSKDAVIKVFDNGMGIIPEVLDTLRSLKDGDQQGQNGQHVPAGIGLKNINKRLEYYFGDRWDFHIESTPGQGTLVTIKLPCLL